MESTQEMLKQMASRDEISVDNKDEEKQSQQKLIVASSPSSNSSTSTSSMIHSDEEDDEIDVKCIKEIDDSNQENMVSLKRKLSAVIEAQQNEVDGEKEGSKRPALIYNHHSQHHGYMDGVQVPVSATSSMSNSPSSQASFFSALMTQAGYGCTPGGPFPYLSQFHPYSPSIMGPTSFPQQLSPSIMSNINNARKPSSPIFSGADKCKTNFSIDAIIGGGGQRYNSVTAEAQASHPQNKGKCCLWQKLDYCSRLGYGLWMIIN